MLIPSCRDCVFAIYDDNVQVGCKEERLEKLVANGAELEKVHDEEYDLTHYLIHKRFCNRCVAKESLGDTPRIKWRETIVDLTTIRVAMVLYVGEDVTKEDVDKSLDSILAQSELPYCIYVIVDNDDIDRNAIGDRFRMAQGLFYWKVEKVLEPGWGFEKAVNYILFKTPALYFTSCNAGFEYPPDFIERIDTAINTDMKQVVAILPDENNNGLFVQHKLYDDVVKSEGFPFVDNLIALAEAHGQEAFILKAIP